MRPVADSRMDRNGMTLQFDMFPDGQRETARKRGRSGSSSPFSRELTEADMVPHLQGTGRYRILRKLEPTAVAEIIRPEFPLRGVILDTATTGLDHREDEIIEIT